MRIYCVQLEIAWEDKLANYQKVYALLAKADVAPGSLILLPEMFSTGFSMNVPGIRERNGETQTFLAQAARDLKCFFVGGLVNSPLNSRGKNEAVAVRPDGTLAARYDKIRLFTPGGESTYYLPGSQVVLFPCNNFTVCPFICYDLRFPDLFREGVRRGAQLFVVIANWPAARSHHWLTLLQARAIENQAYVAGVNRCGQDPKHHYDGQSLIVGPAGEILAQADATEQVISAELDLQKLQTWRTEFPALQDAAPLSSTS